MIIEKNPKELAAMEEFHKGNRKEGLRLRKNLPLSFMKNIRTRITVPVLSVAFWVHHS